MKIYALSDIHVDYDSNKAWIAEQSKFDYQEDILILAGDITDSLSLLGWCLKHLACRFKKVLYVPGNHDLWVIREAVARQSLEKFQTVRMIVEDSRASMQPYHDESISIVPLLAWYDYSFGRPGSELLASWMDYRACRWPPHFGMNEITAYFMRMNEPALRVTNQTVISFSHFLPRIDLMPSYIPTNRRFLYPILGSSKLETQIRRLKPKIHVYGHSHVNQEILLDGTLYINNAFGYPHETRIAAKRLICIHESSTTTNPKR